MADLTDDQIEKLVDRRCDDFERAWTSEDRPEIGDAVLKAPAAAREALFGELIALELELRTRTGELPQIVGYLGQYPDRAEAIHRAFGEFQAWAQSTSAIHESLKPAIASQDQDTARDSVDTPTSPESEPADTKTPMLDATPPSGLTPAGPDSPLGRGTRLGTYELVSLLGQGGMGTVYRARHTRLGRTVALKVLLPGLLGRGEAVTRFESEIRALGPLDHKNVVHAVDADESGGFYYCVMDFVPGVDLARMSKQLGPLPAADACELIRQAAEGLDYLSQNGIVHRDLKPANLMVCAGLAEHGVTECSRQKACCEWAPLVKILDMGLARLRQWREENEPITSTGQMLGTIDFMAPEQLDDSHDVDIRADIYSLGATLYQLLTGRPPYPSSSRLHKLKALATESPPSVGSLRSDLPEPLVAAVDRMLQRDVADRFQTPGQVAEALAPFSDGADLRALARQVPRRDEPLTPISPEAEPEPLIPVDDLQGPSPDGAPSITSPKRKRGTVNEKPSLARRASVVRAVAVILVVALAAIAVMMFRVKTPYGEVIVHAAEGTDVEIEVTQNGKKVDVIGPQEGWRVRVAEGRYDLVLRSTDRELSLNKDTVTVSRNGKTEVKIVRRSPKPADSRLSLRESTPGGSATVDDPAITHSDLPLVKIFQGTTGPVQSLAFTGDGSALVSSDRGGAVRIWDVASAVERDACEDLDPVIAVAVSPDQRLIAVGTIGRGITIIQLSDAQPVRTLADDMRHVLGLDWSPDGRWLLAADYSGSVMVWDMEQEGEAERLVEPGGRVESVRFSRDSATALVAGVQHGLSVWNVPQWSLRVEIDDGYSVAALSPSGDRVATRGTVFDTATGEMVTSYEASRFPVGTMFSPDGRHIISCESTQSLTVVEVATAQVVARIEMNTSCIDALAISPDGKYVVTAGGLAYNSQTKGFVDSGDYTIRMWRLPAAVWPVPEVASLGRFHDSGQRLGGGCSRAVRLGDFDADGDLDAFVLNQFDEPNRVWLNDGQGTFADSGQRLGNFYSWDLALGDVDGDGDLDAFVVNCKGQSSRIWMNDGQGSFSDSGQRIPSVDARGVALADLDDDGDLDAMLAGRGANTVWRNDGTGIFEDSGLRLGSGDSCCVALADVNGDGAVDAFVGNCGYSGGESNRVWFGDGQGRFTESGQPLGDASTAGISLADLDGDGDIDAFAANHGLRHNRIWRNDGTGRFAGIEHMGLLRSVRISLGDFNGDENLDALIVNAENKPNEVLYNGGPGIYSRQHVQWLGISSSSDSALGDLDGDGDLDAFVANLEGQPNRVWFYREPGETPAADQPAMFVDSGQELGSSNSLHVSLADLDGDDDLDAFVANYKQPNHVWWNDGGGVFRDSGQSLGESRSTRVALGDLDGDGDLDVFVPNVGNQPNTVFLNEGDGVFRDSGQMLGNSGSKAAMLRDFDGDGDLDAFVVNYYHGQPNRVWLNDGQGQFTDSGQALGSSESEGLAVGDLDGDGDEDAFVANLSDQPNRVYWNDGKGTFTDSGQQLGQSYSKAVSVTDLDGDGDLDAFVTNDGPNRVWLNDGQGTFRDSGQELGNLHSYFVVLDDIDDDGDCDALVVNGGPNVVWLNNGEGLFEVGQLLGRSHTSIGVALADFDDDGDLDAFIANHDGQPNHAWLNQRVGETPDQPQVSQTVQTANHDDSSGDSDDHEGTPVDGGDVLAGVTITVNTSADILDGDTSSIDNLIANPGADGAISLREAIIAANNTAGNDTIDVSVKGAITLSIAGTDEDAAATGDLDILSSITIQGDGARSTIIDGGGIDRVFDIEAEAATVNLIDLTIRNGATSFGGGIHIHGDKSRIHLDRVRVTRNHARENAGGMSIEGEHPTMIVNIRNSLIDNNVSAGENGGGSGGIVVFPSGTVSIVNTTISANKGVSAGGILAQFNGGGSLDIVNSTITGNISTFPTAGGVQKNDFTGKVTLTNSIVAGNTSDQFLGEGGAVIESGGHNIVGPGSEAFHMLGSDMEFDGAIKELLCPLADNGGPTDTHALAADGLAVDAGNNDAATEAGLTSDQRSTGFDRIVNGSVDIGAFEFVPAGAETATGESTAPQEP